VQNSESQALTDDGYSYLGFFQLSLLYLSLGIGCLFATAIQDRIGSKFCMALGSLGDMSWILSQVPVALSAENPDNTSFFLSNGFIYPVSLFIACLSGFGDAL
jgi:hypothetical protein